MGCVSSTFLNNEDDFTHQLGSSTFSQHIVSLTSTTYGLLNLDPPPSSATATATTPPRRFTLGSILYEPISETKILNPSDNHPPEKINSWELMSGLDAESFRLSPIITTKDKEISNLLDKCEKICPPNGENKVVIYTTSLRGVRRTFEACNVTRAVFEGFGVVICERDVSMDRGFREELRELMKGKEREESIPPRVFVKGRYVGGVEEVMKIVEEGRIGELLHGLAKKKVGSVCEGCGDVRFLPCFSCNGSCKVVVVVEKEEEKSGRKSVMVRCSECNENGLVLCPICS